MTNCPPLCSVVVPVYKHEKWLKECLDSVLNQTYPRLELIIVDDFSPDDSFELAQSLISSTVYALRFERIVCERNPRNFGAHYSLNRGIEAARGDYLFLLNSDDRYHTCRISRMVEEMKAANSRFAFSALSLLLTPGSQIPESLQNGLASLDLRAPMLPSLSFAFLQFNCTATTGNFALHRDLADLVGPFIDLKLTHDWDYALRAIAFEEPLYVPEALYEYRLHPTNTFIAVADKAVVETQICHSRYFAFVATQHTHNRNAPTQSNWPRVFEHYLDLWGLRHAWNAARGFAENGKTLYRGNARTAYTNQSI